MDLPFDVPAEHVRAELAAYLADAAHPAAQSRPTRCPPWTVRDVSAHLAETFARFNRLLAQSRAGDMTPPFGPMELSAENLRRVAAFTGDPLEALAREATTFLDAVTDQDELIAHQFGPIPMRLQLGFALSELAVHHDDIANAMRQTYEPAPETTALLAQLWTELGGLPIPEPTDTDWKRILRRSGR